MTFSREVNPGLGRSGRVRPQLEVLEDRCCPSAGLSFQNHVLKVTGDPTHDSKIVIRDNGLGAVTATLTETIDGKSKTYTSADVGVQVIDVTSVGADDQIDYALTKNLKTNETLNLFLGNGSDQVRLNYLQGVSASKLNINLYGGSGDEDVSAVFGAIDNTDLQLTARLGSGWDHFLAQIHGDLAGTANVNVRVQGGSGVDGFDVETRGNIGAKAQLNVTAVVGAQDNTLHVDYAGKLAGKLSIWDQAGAGWDWLETHIDLTPGSTGSVAAHVLGGSGSDLLILSLQDKGSKLTSVNTQINAGTGDNTVSHTANVKVVNPPH